MNVYYRFSRPINWFVCFTLLILAVLAVLPAQAGPALQEFIIKDGRANPEDLAAAAAIYCHTETGIEIWMIDRVTANGTLIIRATYGDISRVSNTPVSSAAIASSHGFVLYRLSNGFFELVSPPDFEGKVYRYSFSPTDADCSLDLPTAASQLIVPAPAMPTVPTTLYTAPPASATVLGEIRIPVIVTGPFIPVLPRPTNPPEIVEGLPGYLIVNTDNLFLRVGAGAEFRPIGILDGGTRLVVLGRNADRSWWFVQVAEFEGWINGEFTIVRGDLTDIPEVDTLGDLTPPTLYVGFAGNVLYVLPDIGSTPICVLDGEKEYAVVGTTDNVDWYQLQVDCNGTVVTGWLQAERGVLRNPAAVLIPVPFEVSEQAALEAQLGDVLGQEGYLIVNTDNLNLRSGDGPQYTSVGVVDGGTILLVLGRNEDRSWWFVQAGEWQGWVLDELVLVRGDLTDIPVVPSMGQLIPPTLYVGFTGNPIYELPDLASPLCAIPGDTFFPVLGRTGDSSWFQIAATCGGTEVVGWIQADRGILSNPAEVDIPLPLLEVSTTPEPMG